MSGGLWPLALRGGAGASPFAGLPAALTSAPTRWLLACEVVEVHVLAVVFVRVLAFVIPVPEHQYGAGGGQQNAGDEEDDAAEPGRGVGLADGPGLVCGILDVLAADGIYGGVEGVEEEDDHQKCDGHDGDDRAGDQRRFCVAGQSLRAPAPRPGVVVANRVLPGRVR